MRIFQKSLSNLNWVIPVFTFSYIHDYYSYHFK